MIPKVTMREALSDTQLLGAAMLGESWRPWRVLLIACMGEDLDEDERALFREFTGLDYVPGMAREEIWVAVGRRAGKTTAAGVLAVYIACLCTHDALAPGERGVLPIMAASTTQASRAFLQVARILDLSPLLKGLVESQTADTIRLSTFVDVEIRPANFRTIRSITAVAAIADEIAFWSVEGSSNPDSEILNALRPALATTGGPLIVISSPYARRGELYEMYRRHYAKADDPLILYAKGPSRLFNPSLSQRFIDRAYVRDPVAAAAEFGGEFRTDVETFVSVEAAQACVSRGVFERGRIDGLRYTAFVDPSGGARDSFTMAIAHHENGAAVLDLVRERKPPFSPEGVAEEYAGVLKSYGITEVRGDRYSGEFVRELFRKCGVEYRVSDKVKSDIYGELLPALNSGRVDLLDNDRMLAQLVGLERRTSRGGKDSIDHAPGSHDDLINAAAGAIVEALELRQRRDDEPIGAPIQVFDEYSIQGGNFI